MIFIFLFCLLLTGVIMNNVIAIPHPNDSNSNVRFTVHPSMSSCDIYYPPMPEPSLSMNLVMKGIDSWKGYRFVDHTVGNDPKEITKEEFKTIIRKCKWMRSVPYPNDINNAQYYCPHSPLLPRWKALFFETRGDWDDPRFSETERILAWRIECLRLGTLTKY